MSVYEVIPNSLSFVENTLEATIQRGAYPGPAWTSLKVVEGSDSYVFIIGDSRDRWDGKIVMKWVCKKGKYEDPKRDDMRVEIDMETISLCE